MSFAACAKQADDAKNAADKQVKQFEINSKWISNCQPAAWFGLASKTEDYDFGASLSKTTLVYKENNCATAEVRVTENGGYNVGNKLANSDAYELNERFNSVAVMPMTAEVATALNLVGACSIHDWAAGTERDVTAASQTDLACWKATPRNLYDIAMISSNQLKFGLEKDGLDRTAPEKRPGEIDQTVTFTKH